MAVNGMNLGVDYQFGLFDGFSQAIINLGDVQSVTMVAHKSDVKSMPYNAPPRYAHVYDGYSGTFDIVRTSAILENLQIIQNNAFDAGAVIPTGFLQETVNNPDGSVSVYQYVNVDWFMTNPGHVSRDKETHQTVEWKASKKVQIA